MNVALILNPPLISDAFTLKWRIILRIFWILCVLSIISLLVFYIFQVNVEIGEKYLIQEYEKKLGQILEENNKLEINSVQSNSLNNISELVNTLNFEKTDKIKYIHVLENQVVSK